MGENAELTVECMTRARTSVLRGVARLEHDETRTRIFVAISADLEATGMDPYSIDLTEVVFMNSSAIRALAALVLSAKRAGRRLTIVGRQSVPWQDRTLKSLSALYEKLEVRLTPPSTTLVLRRDGESWTLGTPERTLRLKESKGLGYLQRLFAEPNRDLHVLEIIGMEVAGDAGPILDERAKAEYRSRLADLGEALAEAERFNDVNRATQARTEMEALAQQLATAVGLGGRDRRSASDTERARVNVRRCLKEALDRIAAADPALGRYLSATIKTGTFCSFKPL